MIDFHGFIRPPGYAIICNGNMMLSWQRARLRTKITTDRPLRRPELYSSCSWKWQYDGGLRDTQQHNLMPKISAALICQVFESALLINAGIDQNIDRCNQSLTMLMPMILALSRREDNCKAKRRLATARQSMLFWPVRQMRAPTSIYQRLILRSDLRLINLNIC